MSEIKGNNTGFVAYESKEITVARKNQTMYIENYAHFGWKFDGVKPSYFDSPVTVLKFKRDRKIQNKAELTRLSAQFDSLVKNIDKLENSKERGSTIVACAIGFLAVICLAFGIYCIRSDMLPPGVALTVLGVVGFIIPYFCYAHLAANKGEKTAPFIDEKYDALHETCAKASALLYK